MNSWCISHVRRLKNDKNYAKMPRLFCAFGSTHNMPICDRVKGYCLPYFSAYNARVMPRFHELCMSLRIIHVCALCDLFKTRVDLIIVNFLELLYIRLPHDLCSIYGHISVRKKMKNYIFETLSVFVLIQLNFTSSKISNFILHSSILFNR